MSATHEDIVLPVWRIPAVAWAAFVGVATLLGIMFFSGISFLVRQWDSPEYGYAYLIPFITGFLIWQRKDQLETIPFHGSWAGMTVVLAGVALLAAGKFSALHVLIQYALLVVVIGLFLTFLGKPGFKKIWVPLLLLVFMIPLPGFLYQTLSNELQLLSSEIGVAVIRLFGISVYLEGNVIDLGSFKLQVVEACNGLRYLFPLMTLGFIAAYFYQAPLWKRMVVFLSTIPITVFMNSLRIGMIGLLVEYWGQSMAEGFLHDFEGWAVFMSSIAVLIGEMWLLSKIGGDRRPLREIFGIEFPAPSPKDADARRRPLPKPFLGAVGILAIATVGSLTLPDRTDIIPARKDFADFPLQFGEWQGQGERMERIYINALNFDDYILANFVGPEKQVVNLYIGYYQTQRADKVPHSPRACIPGGGWEISELTRRELTGVFPGERTVPINRVLIQKGEYRHLVYYWFQQRGRPIASEWLVKGYLFWDAVTRNRTDGALVRLTTLMERGEDPQRGDARLTDMARTIGPILVDYIPD